MSTRTDEKKPATDSGLDPIVLKDFDALIFRRYGDAVFVSTLGGVHSEPPRCCDVVNAAINWVAKQPRERFGVEMSLRHPQEAEGIKHILAFVQAMESSYWHHYEPAAIVEVPGLGQWVFSPDANG